MSFVHRCVWALQRPEDWCTTEVETESEGLWSAERERRQNTASDSRGSGIIENKQPCVSQCCCRLNTNLCRRQKKLTVPQILLLCNSPLIKTKNKKKLPNGLNPSWMSRFLLKEAYLNVSHRALTFYFLGTLSLWVHISLSDHISIKHCCWAGLCPSSIVTCTMVWKRRNKIASWFWLWKSGVLNEHN